MPDPPPRRDTTRKMLPGTPLSLDWGEARCAGEAIVVGGGHALVLSRESVRPGTRLELHNEETGDRAPFSVLWCGPADASGRCKLGLRLEEESRP